MGPQINSNREKRMIQSLNNIPNFIEISPDGFSGGLWLLWENEVNF